MHYTSYATSSFKYAFKCFRIYIVEKILIPLSGKPGQQSNYWEYNDKPPKARNKCRNKEFTSAQIEANHFICEEGMDEINAEIYLSHGNEETPQWFVEKCIVGGVCGSLL